MNFWLHHLSTFTYEKITLSLLFSGVVGVHGLSHLGLEGVYGYNPLKSAKV